MPKRSTVREILIGVLLMSILVSLMVLTFRSGDQDGDGFNRYIDCNDTDASVHPGASEVCDGIDNDCDGAVDEGVNYASYIDIDGDGFGDCSAPIFACVIPSGYVTNSDDCDDSDSSVNPGATEVIDNIDNNCDGEVDKTAYWHDGDIDESPVRIDYYQGYDSDGPSLP